MVDATLPRWARLGAILVRPAVLVDMMESRKSGTKKCWSLEVYGELLPDEGDMEGIGGTGGTSRSGDPGLPRLVTPGMYAIWIMLEARVRTDEAMEATVCVDARALRRDWKSLSFSCSAMSTSFQSGCCEIGRLFPLRQYFHTTNVTMATKAIPPMTPPAMAPTLVLLAGGGLMVGSTWQLTEAHVSHVREFWTQTWLAGHLMPSQDSGACSHSLQRFSMRKTFSASGNRLAWGHALLVRQVGQYLEAHG